MLSSCSACKQHSSTYYIEDGSQYCPACWSSRKSYLKDGKVASANDDAWVQGWWEHIDTKPIYIENKKHLIAECAKRGVMPKALMRRKSQGKGSEIRR